MTQQKPQCECQAGSKQKPQCECQAGSKSFIRSKDTLKTSVTVMGARAILLVLCLHSQTAQVQLQRNRWAAGALSPQSCPYAEGSGNAPDPRETRSSLPCVLCIALAFPTSPVVPRETSNRSTAKENKAVKMECGSAYCLGKRRRSAHNISLCVGCSYACGHTPFFSSSSRHSLTERGQCTRQMQAFL